MNYLNVKRLRVDKDQLRLFFGFTFDFKKYGENVVLNRIPFVVWTTGWAKMCEFFEGRSRKMSLSGLFFRFSKRTP